MYCMHTTVNTRLTQIALLYILLTVQSVVSRAPLELSLQNLVFRRSIILRAPPSEHRLVLQTIPYTSHTFFFYFLL